MHPVQETSLLIPSARGEVISQRRPSGGYDGQPAAEADAHQPDSTVWCQAGFHRQPHSGLFNPIGQVGRDLEA